jgi:hypothetical protein
MSKHVAVRTAQIKQMLIRQYLFYLIQYYWYCCVDCPIWKYVKTHNGMHTSRVAIIILNKCSLFCIISSLSVAAAGVGDGLALPGIRMFPLSQKYWKTPWETQNTCLTAVSDLYVWTGKDPISAFFRVWKYDDRCQTCRSAVRQLPW